MDRGGLKKNRHAKEGKSQTAVQPVQPNSLEESRAEPLNLGHIHAKAHIVEETKPEHLNLEIIKAVAHSLEERKAKPLNLEHIKAKPHIPQEIKAMSDLDCEKSPANKIHTEEQPFSCTLCEKSFPLKEHLVLHTKLHSEVPLFTCTECGKSFPHKGHLVLHQRRHVGVGSFSCTECDMIFPRKTYLMAHQKVHTVKRSFACTECEMTFPQKKNLVVHKKLVHARERLFSCAKCEMTFTRKMHLVVHQRVHTGETLFSCTQCEKTFPRKAHLSLHLKTHIEDKPYSCRMCDKRFLTHTKLIKHQRTHIQKILYSCLECGKCFDKISSLERHHIVHTGVKSFPCSQCGKSFSQMAYLQRHKRIHTGEKPYSCSQCGKCFNQTGNLRTHEKLHARKLEAGNQERQTSLSKVRDANRKRHLKTLAQKHFSRAQYGEGFGRQKRVLGHHNVQGRPYCCKVCQTRFSRLTNLIKHQRIHMSHLQSRDSDSEPEEICAGDVYRKPVLPVQDVTDSENEEDYELFDRVRGASWDRRRKRNPLYGSLNDKLQTKNNNLNKHTEKEKLEAPAVRSGPVVLKAATFVFSSLATVASSTTSPLAVPVQENFRTPPTQVPGHSSVIQPSVPLDPLKPQSDSEVGMLTTLNLDKKEDNMLPHVNSLE